MRKRVLSLLLALALACSLLVFPANAVEVLDSGDYFNLSWVLTSDGVVTISGVGGIGRDLKDRWSQWGGMVKSINMEPGVNYIDYYAFKNCSNLESVTIPGSVTSIEASSFVNCTNLTTVTIGEGVNRIGSGAFSGCTNLTNLVIPDSVNYIGDYAFASCYKLENIVIPEGVSIIEKKTFDNCVGLKSVHLPDTVTAIEESAFMCCTSLRNINIPKNVTTIGETAFYTCSEMTSVTIPASTTSIGYAAFRFCDNLIEFNVDPENPKYQMIDNVLFNKNGTQLILACPKRVAYDYFAPDGVIQISDYAFESCTSIYDITLSDSVTRIGKLAFNGCKNLQFIVIPGCVKEIGYGAFNFCNQLNNVYFKGLEEQWNAISIADENDPLLNATIHFATPLTLTAQPSDFVGKVNSTASFSVSAEGDGLSYQWEVSTNGGRTWSKSSITQAKYAAKLTTEKDGRMVRCIVTDQYHNSVTSNAVTMHVAKLNITTQPVDYSGALNSTARFNVAAAGTGTLHYQWQVSTNYGKSWSKSSVTQAVYAAKLTAEKDNRMVRCIVTDDYGNSVTSEPAAMHIQKQLAITRQPEDYSGALDSQARFTVAAIGEGLTYQWQVSTNGGRTWSQSSVKSAVYSAKLTAEKNNRMVRCVVTDKNGNSVTSEPATMKITTLSIVTQPVNYTGAENSTARFTVVATGEGLSYQWQVSTNGGRTWSQSSVKSAVYAAKLTAAKDGRMVRCVITDASNHSVTSNAATMRIG